MAQERERFSDVISHYRDLKSSVRIRTIQWSGREDSNSVADYLTAVCEEYDVRREKCCRSGMLVCMLWECEKTSVVPTMIDHLKEATFHECAVAMLCEDPIFYDWST